MKKIFYFGISFALLCANLSLSSCSKDDDDDDNSTTVVETTLEVNPSSLSLTSEKNATGSFTLTTNAAWTASCDATWLNLSSKSGSSGTTNITVTATSKNSSSQPRTTMITLAAGSISKTISVTQLSDVLDLAMTISDPITLTESAAFKLTKVGNVFRFYFGCLDADYVGATDEQILSALLQNAGYQPSDMTLYGIPGLTENKEYFLCSVAYNQAGDRGPIQKTLIKTQASKQNRARVIYGNVTYDSSYWHWETTIGAFASKYYMVSAGGYTAYEYITEYIPAMVAWEINESVKNGSASPIVQSGAWKKSRSASDTYFFSAAWAVDAYGNWSPDLDYKAGSISSSAKSFMNINEDKKQSIVRVDYNDFLKLKANTLFSHK